MREADDDVRRQKFEVLADTMSQLYNIDVMIRGAPTMTVATLQRLPDALTYFYNTWTSAYENDEAKIKLHHIRDHLSHAAGWWPRAFASVEQQEAANPFLRGVYLASNHINPVLTVANAAAARIEARILRMRLDLIGMYV